MNNLFLHFICSAALVLFFRFFVSLNIAIALALIIGLSKEIFIDIRVEYLDLLFDLFGVLCMYNLLRKGKLV